jgi:hypothetical protein
MKEEQKIEIIGIALEIAHSREMHVRSPNATMATEWKNVEYRHIAELKAKLDEIELT